MASGQITPQTAVGMGSRGGKKAAITRAASTVITNELARAAASNQRGGELVTRFLESERPGTGEARYEAMLRAADKRALAGDMKAIAWFWDRAHGKAALAASDREALRPIMQLVNNQLNMHQGPPTAPPTISIAPPTALPTTSPTTSAPVFLGEYGNVIAPPAS